MPAAVNSPAMSQFSEPQSIAPVSGKMSQADLGKLIDDGAWSTRQKFFLFLVGSAIIFDGFDNQVLGLAAPAIIRDWGVSKEMLAPILAIGQFGMLLGTAFGGALGDRFGRKIALLFSVLVFGLATTAMAAADNITTLGILRLIAGVGLGGALPNAAAYISEYTPLRSRSFAVTASIVCVPLGGVFGGLIAAQLLPVTGWRSLFLVAGCLPVILALLLWVLLPESGRFVLSRHGDSPQLRTVLRKAGIVAPASVKLVDMASGEAATKAPIRQILSSSLRRDTFLLWTAFGFCLMGIYAGFSWLPTMLSESGFGLAASSRGLMAFNLGGVFTALFSAWMIAFMGSRLPMVTMAVLGAISAIAIYLFPLSPDQPQIVTILVLALLGGFVNGVQTTLYALAAHIYPVSARATGVGAASSVGRIGAITSSFAGASILTSLGSGGFYILMTISMVVTAAALMAIKRHVVSVA
jgi:AAHS family 4-hydroxybenzoate transporter-like MFS transporter